MFGDGEDSSNYEDGLRTRGIFQPIVPMDIKSPSAGLRWLVPWLSQSKKQE
jgi:hypothetical protein